MLQLSTICFKRWIERDGSGDNELFALSKIIKRKQRFSLNKQTKKFKPTLKSKIFERFGNRLKIYCQ